MNADTRTTTTKYSDGRTTVVKENWTLIYAKPGQTPKQLHDAIYEAGGVLAGRLSGFCSLGETFVDMDDPSVDPFGITDADVQQPVLLYVSLSDKTEDARAALQASGYRFSPARPCEKRGDVVFLDADHKPRSFEPV